MPADVVIRAEKLGKKYVIGHNATDKPSTLRDAIVGGARNWGRSVRNMATGAANVAGDELEEFWALKDVDFEIRRGDVVGIVGRNGAGKSTLLKVLSRITEPSEGRVEIKGRIASLLEVGTGFHPELSGRENIYLNGAILGMSRAEIARKFDEIVDFAEIDKFLDTPVKRYSSGMYVRLAFAVAAHLEPEILIVDEVLAVGDAEFQKKCLGKMQDVAGHGRTVLFVSHNLAAIRSLCRRAIYLTDGRIRSYGDVSEVADLYMSRGADGSVDKNPIEYQRRLPLKSETPWVASVRVTTSSGNELHEYGRPIRFEIRVGHERPLSHPSLALQLHNQNGAAVVLAVMDNEQVFKSSDGHTTFICEMPFLRLNVGRYFVTIHVAGPPGSDHYETAEQICMFEVVRTSDHSPWGWRADVCTYFEEALWRTGRLDSGNGTSSMELAD